MISQRGVDKLPALSRPQAQIPLAPAVYLRRNPKVAADFAARLAVLVAGLAFIQWPLMVAGIALLIWPVRQYIKVFRLLRQGYPCAAKVISLEPPLAACVVEMSYVASASYPVLKILPVELTFEAPGMERGDRVAMVALPRDGTPIRAEKLDLLLVSCVSDAEREPVLEAVPEWHWDDLEDGLFRLEQPYRVGLFDLAR